MIRSVGSIMGGFLLVKGVLGLGMRMSFLLDDFVDSGGGGRSEWIGLDWRKGFGSGVEYHYSMT